MSLKDLKQTIQVGTTIALATTGLTTCNNNGAVDPAPPPLSCTSTAVDRAEELNGNGTVDANGDITITLTWWSPIDPPPSFQGDFRASAGTGLTVKSSTASVGATVVVALAQGSTSGTFDISGTVRDHSGATCGIARTYTVSRTGQGITVVRLSDPLPLFVRDPVTIGVLEHRGSEIELVAETTGRTRERIEWTVSGGALREVEAESGRVVWTLPSEPGFYQIELLVRYGDDGRSGIAFNSLAVEVLA
jgi:hypothetical protein